MNRSPTIAALLLWGATHASLAAEPHPLPTSRYALKQVRVEPATSSDSGRYTVRARLAPAESAGELREGANFSLIGRFAKAGASCGPIGSSIFKNGFEATP